jgi:mRNA-degrading endonuclease RelE of RelBE toxin-antitoxin system
MIAFRIADTFTDSLSRLTGEEQKAVNTAAFDLQLNPAQPSMQLHKLDWARDPHCWSVRVSRDIRLILHKTDASLLLCYVDHHDNAHRLAERRKPVWLAWGPHVPRCNAIAGTGESIKSGLFPRSHIRQSMVPAQCPTGIPKATAFGHLDASGTSRLWGPFESGSVAQHPAKCVKTQSMPNAPFAVFAANLRALALQPENFIPPDPTHANGLCRHAYQKPRREWTVYHSLRARTSGSDA